MSSDATPVRDFFISYNSADEDWATWIAWQLEQAEYTTIIQAWDFRPGSNFALEMDEAAERARRTLLVISPSFVASKFVQPEWAAAFAKDPTGKGRVVLPVMIAETNIPSMLKQIVHINLVGLDRDAAARKLIAGVDLARSKPASEPSFPGMSGAPASPPPPPTAPHDVDLDWRPIAGEPVYTPRTALLPNTIGRSYRAALEVALVPETPQSLRVAQLAGVAEEMATVGRQSGLFSQEQSIERAHTSEAAFAFRRADRSGEEAGLIVSRAGQRTIWVSLPGDTLGSVFDARQSEPRIASMLQTLAKLGPPLPERIAFTATVSPLMMLTVGDADVVGRRTSASMRASHADPFPLSMPDSVRGAAVTANVDELAAELTARIVAALA